MLMNFEEGLLKCSDQVSREHITEAIRCYEAGAYRSAIVASYVAMSFDLIAKLRQLKDYGDAEAFSLLKTLEELQEKQLRSDPIAIQGLLKFERELPQAFKDKFQFFGVIEFEEIQRLVVDRNRCAHPAFLVGEDPYQPAAEVARLHIRNTINFVLSQEPRHGKAALSYLRNIICSATFPKDDAAVRSRLDLPVLKNARPSLVLGLVDELMFGAVTKGNSYYNLAKTRRATYVVLEMHRAIAIPRYVKNLNKIIVSDDEFARQLGAAMALQIPDAGNQLIPAGHDVVRDYVRSKRKVPRGLAVQASLQLDWLKETGVQEAAILESRDFGTLKPPIESAFLNRAVELMLTPTTLQEANSVFRDLLGVSSFFSFDQIQTVLLAATRGTAIIVGSAGFDAFLRTVAVHNKVGKKGLVALLEEYGLPEPEWDEPDAE